MKGFKTGAYKKQLGFSLVELMVAMVIGLIIILGAGQLFLTVFQTNRQVQTLSEKQAAVNFAVEVILRDVRRADPRYNWGDGERGILWDSNENKLTLRVPNRGDISGCDTGVNKVYRLSDSPVGQGLGRALEMAQSCGSALPTNFEQVVAGFEDNNGAIGVDDSLLSQGVVLMTLSLMPTGDGSPDFLKFYAVNRTAAVTNE
ncbi:hypothetical protein BWR19_17315 [Halomonas sp. 1513]|nr:prepilin-type N-terminal cleavage/methylation domain-containing protein [Halomonas sp. 1513]APX94544.1 hypothetical protein BWR19_17315 [Halomonas sp. 1513]